MHFLASLLAEIPVPGQSKQIAALVFSPFAFNSALLSFNRMMARAAAQLEAP
jgi:hypothetical protein